MVKSYCLDHQRELCTQNTMSGQKAAFTVTDVATKIGLTVDVVNTEIAIKGKTLEDLAKDGHKMVKRYHIMGLTPEELIEEKGGSTFKLSILETDFAKICLDYEDALVSNVASKALEFCGKVIYEIGPESRKVGGYKKDKTWRIIFSYKDQAPGAVKPVIKVAFISTYRINQTYKQSHNDNSITLSVKHATLISMKTLGKIAQFASNMVPSKILLTPLAGAIFCSKDVIKMASLSNAKLNKFIMTLNESCQSGGHYLPHATASCALAAIYASTHGLVAKGKESLRASIINKTARQYYNAKKEFTREHFVMYCIFARGEVPPETTVKSLTKLFKGASKIDVKELKLMEIVSVCKMTELTTKTKELEAAGTSYTVANESKGDRTVVTHNYTISEILKSGWAKLELGGAAVDDDDDASEVE